MRNDNESFTRFNKIITKLSFMADQSGLEKVVIPRIKYKLLNTVISEYGSKNILINCVSNNKILIFF